MGRMSDDKTSVYSVPELLDNESGQSAFLIVISAKSTAGIGRMHKLDKAQEVILGRSTECQLQVDDDGISRRHARVGIDQNGQFRVVDLGSTNGTYVNGVRVDAVVLKDGDKIQIGSNTVLRFSLQDQMDERYQRSIYESATRDGLTRIFNKKYFLETLRKEFAYCLRHRVPLSVLMFDVDHFKKINDSFGHQAGDYVLARIAQRINETIRTEDVFARYGGEEFAILLRESTEEQGYICAERCRRAIDSADFVFANTPMRVTISLGIASLLDSDYTNPEDLIAAADRYLYRAKKAGRNKVESKLTSGA